MDVVVQPPSTARAGTPLPGAVIVRLRTTNIEPEEVVGDSSHLYAYATLVPGPGSNVTNDPRRLGTLLRGPRFDSVRSFRDAAADGSISFMEMDDPRGVGVMIFNGLEIWQAGSYRIRITLMRYVNEPDGREGHVTLQAVESNPILVQGASPPTRLAQNGLSFVRCKGAEDGEEVEIHIPPGVRREEEPVQHQGAPLLNHRPVHPVYEDPLALHSFPTDALQQLLKIRTVQ